MLRASLIGFGVTLACVLTPLVHLVLGIPGPFIGGVIGGIQVTSRSRNPLAPAVVGSLMGLLMALATLVLGGPAFFIVRALDLLEDMTVREFLYVPTAVGVYSAVLATGGAYVGGVFGRRRTADAPDPAG